MVIWLGFFWGGDGAFKNKQKQKNPRLTRQELLISFSTDQETPGFLCER
jgi:hypothetical protein